MVLSSYLDPDCGFSSGSCYCRRRKDTLQWTGVLSHSQIQDSQTPRILGVFPWHSSGNGIDSKAGQDIQTAQVLELVTSLGRETCSHLGSSEYCDWTLSGRSRLGVEDRIWVSCDLYSCDSKCPWGWGDPTCNLYNFLIDC